MNMKAEGHVTERNMPPSHHDVLLGKLFLSGTVLGDWKCNQSWLSPVLRGRFGTLEGEALHNFPMDMVPRANSRVLPGAKT